MMITSFFHCRNCSQRLQLIAPWRCSFSDLESTELLVLWIAIGPTAIRITIFISFFWYRWDTQWDSWDSELLRSKEASNMLISKTFYATFYAHLHCSSTACRYLFVMYFVIPRHAQGLLFLWGWCNQQNCGHFLNPLETGRWPTKRCQETSLIRVISCTQNWIISSEKSSKSLYRIVPALNWYLNFYMFLGWTKQCLLTIHDYLPGVYFVVDC